MCNMVNGLFSYWPQFVASITAAQRILGSAGQSWASFRHHALLSPDPGPTALQMDGKPPAGLTGLRNRGARQKGDGELFSPLSVWFRGRKGNWPTLPPFISSLVCFCRQDKEGMGVWELFILIQFLATKSYKNIQRYFTHYQFATVFPSSHCHCPPFPRSSPEPFEKTMYGYIMTFVSYLQWVFPKDAVFSYPQVR